MRPYAATSQDDSGDRSHPPRDGQGLKLPQAMSPHPSAQAYVQLLRELAPLKHVFLIGGFAEDALLHHEITRDRSDLDLLVEAGLWDVLQAQLLGLGITRFEPCVAGRRASHSPSDQTTAASGSRRG